MNKNLRTLSLIAASFTDVSIEMNNYDVDPLSFTLANDVDYIYTGLYKKFKNLYIDVKSNALAGTVKFEYFNGVAWATLNVVDETISLKRSGFIKWDLPDDWSANTVDGKELFHIRMTATIEVELNGVNMVLANDNDLKEHYRNVSKYLGSDVSYIAYHQSSRRDIIQKIRNSGKVKVSSIDNNLSDLTIWDFLDPDQLRVAATYLCLSKIFAGVSDNADGKFIQLSRAFRKDYQNSVDTFLMDVDFNDNGKEDAEEQAANVNITRIKYV